MVRKFDETAAYRSVSGHGLKGVDFLCLLPDGGLWLMEVKNYRTRHDRYRSVRKNPAGLAEHVGTKYSDSKRLIKVVHRALDRQWWPALLLRWYSLHPRPRPNSHYWFWDEARRRIESARTVTCVLWIETPEDGDNYEVALTEALEEWLEPGNKLVVAEMDHPGNLPIEVSTVVQ